MKKSDSKPRMIFKKEKTPKIKEKVNKPVKEKKEKKPKKERPAGRKPAFSFDKAFFSKLFAKKPADSGRKNKTGIKRRIGKLCFLSVCFAVMAMQVYAVFSTYTSYQKSYKEQAESLATAYLQNIQTKIKSLTLELEGIRSNPNMSMVVDSSLIAGTRQVKLSEIATGTMFKDIDLADKNGITLRDVDYSEADYFKRALEGVNTLSSPMMRISDTNNVHSSVKDEQVMVLAVRYKNILFEGVLCGSVDPSFFSQGLDTVGSGSVTVLDKYGNVVAASDLAEVTQMKCYKDNENSGLAKLANAMMTQETGTVSYQTKGVPYVAAYMPIELTDGWTIAVSLDNSVVFANIFKNLITALLIGLIILIVVTRISDKFADKISMPIIKSAERLRKLSEGNISEDFFIAAPKDETRVLCDSLTTTIQELSKYINDIKQVLAAIAEGDLDAHSGIEYKGDFEAIGISLSEITQSLNESIKAVKDSVDSIKQGSVQVADGSQKLSETAAHEAEAVDGIVRIIDNIKQQADSTADISAQVLCVTNEANESAKAGAELMKKLLEAINDINEKSVAINAVIKTIDSIAFQTNILAINASIEAARAGEAGRGFSVVAEEVGNLANMSAEAVKQTAGLINDSITAVKQGTEIADKAEAAINEIVADVNKVAKHMNYIVSAAEEQKQSAARINEGMTRIDESMHTTTITAERSAASSVQLSELAVALSGKVDKFRTN